MTIEQARGLAEQVLGKYPHNVTLAMRDDVARLVLGVEAAVRKEIADAQQVAGTAPADGGSVPRQRKKEGVIPIDRVRVHEARQGQEDQ